VKEHLRAHWKKYAPVLAAAAVAAGAYYGVPPEHTETFLRGVCATLGC